MFNKKLINETNISDAIYSLASKTYIDGLIQRVNNTDDVNNLTDIEKKALLDTLLEKKSPSQLVKEIKDFRKWEELNFDLGVPYQFLFLFIAMSLAYIFQHSIPKETFSYGFGVVIAFLANSIVAKNKLRKAYEDLFSQFKKAETYRRLSQLNLQQDNNYYQVLKGKLLFAPEHKDQIIVDYEASQCCKKPA